MIVTPENKDVPGATVSHPGKVTVLTPGLVVLALPNLGRAVLRELRAGQRDRARNLLVAAAGGRYSPG